MSSTLKNIDRRRFLKSSGGVALFIGVSGILPQLISCSDTKKMKEQLKKHQVTAWVKLSEDGAMTIYNPAAEMGQGSMTSLPIIFAEEMDADWSKVKVEFSPQEAEIYGSEGWSPGSKLMFTVGSRITKSNFPLMRKSGAQARYVLLISAANYWEVPVEELTTADSTVFHNKTNQQLSYGELLPFLTLPDSFPEFTETDYKNPEDYKLVGKIIPRTEIPSKTDGTAQFAGFATLRVEGVQPVVLFGDARLDVDFGATEVSGGMNGFFGTVPGAGVQDFGGELTVTGGQVARDLRLTYAGTLSGGGQQLALSGTMAGAFLGDPVMAVSAADLDPVVVQNGVIRNGTLVLVAEGGAADP
jgi:hypothetical protein